MVLLKRSLLIPNMILQLKTPIKRSSTLSQVEVTAIVDVPGTSVVAHVVIEGIGPKSLVLWDGSDYTTIGQWTDTQASARILELLDTILS